VRPKPYRRQGRAFKGIVKGFVWIVLAIFVLTSVGVVFIATSGR